MIRSLGVVREAAHEVGRAANRALDALADDRVEQEAQFTDRMLGTIEEALRDYSTKGVTWRAKTLTDRGGGAQEREHGADFAGVLSIRLAGYEVDKGFLAQAKLIEPGSTVSPAEWDRMKDQCESMLDRSPDSFLFLYSKREIRVVPAISVVASDRRNPHEFYSRSVDRFYEEHFESFIGDRRIHAPTPAMLDALSASLQTRSALYIQAVST